jgi:hypothetical protein
MYECIYLRFAQPWCMREGGETALLLYQSKKGVRYVEQFKFFPTLDMSFIVHLFEIYLNLEHDRQSTT